MTALPTSIEAALREAGFTGTEILILRHLLEGDGLTLREIASKTGKSTGVLDQSLKKLMRKEIINKTDINENGKYLLTSLNAISEWMQADMKAKNAELSRRVQNFETFISTLEIDLKRPDMTYFEGDEGVKKAYIQLLGLGTKEFLHYFPVFQSAEDDPLRDFRVQYFRERRSRGIFSRVITHNTPLGRRFQSRDPFEYRQTVLVDETVHPFTFEKVIAGNTVACFNLIEKKACFMRFPELADSERVHFEFLWAVEKTKAGAPSQAVVEAFEGNAQVPPGVSLGTKTFSALRDFFLSRRSIATFGAFAVVAAVITAGLYMRTSAMNLQRMKDKVQAIATTASFQFDARDLDKLRIESDWKRPEWTKVVTQLREIRQSNEDILFAYIIRKTRDDPTKGEFVADSHSLNPYANVDDDPTNNVNVGEDDGKFDPLGQEMLQWPGQAYDTMPPEAFIAFTGPTTNEDFYEDQWGHIISGYAPIKDTNGNAVAVVAIDLEYTQLGKLNAQTFTPIVYFLSFFLLFVLIRLFAFNKSLFQELWILARTTRLHWVVPVIVFGVLLAGVGVRYLLWQNAVHATGLRMQAIAATAAKDFSDLDLDSLRTAEDMKTETYQKAFRLLNDVRNRNPGVRYVYIFRQTSQLSTINSMEFVADADSNYFIPEFGVDQNFDGKLDEADESIYPGFGMYGFDESSTIKTLLEGLPVYDMNSDQWGNWISGYGPVFNSKGQLTGILGVDFDIQKVKSL